MEKTVKCEYGYYVLKGKDAIKARYDKLSIKYLALRCEADRIKDQIQQIEGLVEYEQ